MTKTPMDPDRFQMKDIKRRLVKLEEWAIRENDRSRLERVRVAKLEAKLALFFITDETPEKLPGMPPRFKRLP